MKRGSSPRRHGEGKRVSIESKPLEKPRPGRYAQTWLSSEFVTWCQRHHYKPEGLAKCILHTFALETGGNIIIQAHGRPVNVEDIYDLPDRGKEPS